MGKEGGVTEPNVTSQNGRENVIDNVTGERGNVTESSMTGEWEPSMIGEEGM